VSRFYLSLDDFSPDRRTNELKWCKKLVERGVKMDLFVPAAFCRLGEKPNYLSEHLEWAAGIKELGENYRLNLHGFFHRRSKVDFGWHQGQESNNNEWELLNYQQALFLLRRTEDEFKKAGLEFSKVFRAPGWHLSVEAAQLLSDRGYMIAGASKQFEKFKGIANLKWNAYNWDLLTEPPQGNIYAYGHNSNWTKNFLDESGYNKIVAILDQQEYEFGFLGNKQ
jgi:hypothetical protein